MSGLAANLTTQLVNALGRKGRQAVSGKDEQQALQRSVQAGITAMLATVSWDDEGLRSHTKDLFTKLFKSPDVGAEVAELLHGHNIDQAALVACFQKNGFDETTLPQLDLERAVRAFESGFLVAASREAPLQDAIKISILLKGVAIQAETRNSLVELADLLRGEFETLRLQQGQVAALVRNQVTRTVQLVLPGGAEAGQVDEEAFYLRTLVARCNLLDLTPIDETHPQGPGQEKESEVRVSDVFVNLSLKDLTRRPADDIAQVVRGTAKQQKTEKKEEAEERLPVQAIEAIHALPRLVILGQPGGGKSTLTNHVAAQLAARRLGQETDPAKMPGWPATETPLPVVIVLRRFAAWLDRQPSLKGQACVWGYIEHQFQQDGCGAAYPFIRSQLIEEQGAVFFDGLDEIHESESKPLRSRIVGTIKDFASIQDRCKIVVTCREYAYKENDDWHLPKATFPTVELSLFSDQQIRDFNETWYRTVGPDKGWDDQKCADEAGNLNQAIAEWEHLHELAQYPLLLTLMAQVHGRDGYLPKDRADLYKRAVNLLLAHWENRIVRDVGGGRKVEPSLIMQLGVRSEILRTALENVAFDAHERQERAEDRGERAADIAKEDLRDELNRELKDLNKTETVIQYIQERAGLLQARDNRTFSFPHRTFQEYLTACHIMRQEDFDEMLKQRVERDQPWWSEVYLLAAGRVRKTPRNIVELADALLEEEPTAGTQSAARFMRAKLVAQALAETDFAQNITDRKVGRYAKTLLRSQAWLQRALDATEQLSAKERNGAGEALAEIGDPRDYVNTVEAMQFCLVPGGPFIMGSEKEQDKLAYDDESPQHENKLLKEDFWMARFPVTVAQFKEFVNATSHELEDKEWKKDPGNKPVRYVSWYDALAFCGWLTERWRDKLPAGFRAVLPSEAEWEKAARGGLQIPQPVVRKIIGEIADGGFKATLEKNPVPKRIYPWGQEIDANRLNFDETGINTTSVVGCFVGGASPNGCEEMSGNLFEWTRSLDYQKFGYPYDPETGCEDLKAAKDVVRVVRGGAFNFSRKYVRCAFRYFIDPNDRDFNLGFRVALAPFSGL